MTLASFFYLYVMVSVQSLRSHCLEFKIIMEKTAAKNNMTITGIFFLICIVKLLCLRSLSDIEKNRLESYSPIQSIYWIVVVWQSIIFILSLWCIPIQIQKQHVSLFLYALLRIGLRHVDNRIKRIHVKAFVRFTTKETLLSNSSACYKYFIVSLLAFYFS